MRVSEEDLVRISGSFLNCVEQALVLDLLDARAEITKLNEDLEHQKECNRQNRKLISELEFVAEKYRAENEDRFVGAGVCETVSRALKARKNPY